MHDTEVMKGAREGHYTFFALKDEAHKIKRERGRKLKAAVAVPTTKKKAINADLLFSATPRKCQHYFLAVFD